MKMKLCLMSLGLRVYLQITLLFHARENTTLHLLLDQVLAMIQNIDNNVCDRRTWLISSEKGGERRGVLFYS